MNTSNTLKTGAKACHFCLKMTKCGVKYEQIWDVIKNTLGVKFHSKPIYEQKYLKAKVREFDGVKTRNFLGNGVPNENMHNTCIACITIDSVMTIDKKTIRRFI